MKSGNVDFGEIFIDAADNFFLGLCLVQICWKLVAIRSTGGNSDFKLILQIENVSSTKQSCQVTNIWMFWSSWIDAHSIWDSSWLVLFVLVIYEEASSTSWLHYVQTMYLAGAASLGRNEVLEVSKWNITLCNISSSLGGSSDILSP